MVKEKRGEPVEGQVFSPQSSALGPRPLTPAAWFHLALAVWLIALTFVTLRVLIWPHVHTTYPIFAAAALDWLNGADLYYVEIRERNGLDHFRYSPLIAVLLIPFGVLPDALGGVLWRLVNAGAFLGSLAWWLRSAAPHALSGVQQALLFLLALPVVLTSLNNGQSNLLVIGLLLAGLAATADERWNLAAICVALACLLKLYPLAIGLLLVLLHPRKMSWRLATALLLGLALPFALQRPEYVAEQYATWFRLLWLEDRRFLPVTHAHGYQDLWMLVRVWQVPLEPQGYVVVQLGAALLLALCCAAGHLAAWSTRRLLMIVLAFGTCWMTLLGPATESSTYALLAPAWAWTLVEAWHAGRQRWLQGLLGISYGLFLVAAFAGWLPWRAELRAAGIYPLSALLLLAGLVCIQMQDVGGFATSPCSSVEVWNAGHSSVRDVRRTGDTGI